MFWNLNILISSEASIGIVSWSVSHREKQSWVLQVESWGASSETTGKKWFDTGTPNLCLESLQFAGELWQLQNWKCICVYDLYLFMKLHESTHTCLLFLKWSSCCNYNPSCWALMSEKFQSLPKWALILEIKCSGFSFQEESHHES